MNRAETLRQLTQLCNLNPDGVAPPAVEASGFAEFDAALPGGGWQSGTIVELMPAETGIGELRLLMPALARITQADRYIALISPPYIPFAPALERHGIQLERLLVIRAQKNEDALWAFEQTLRCRSFGAVLAWPTVVKDREVRRLQLAAEAGRSTGFLYRSPAAALEASPAALRLQLSANPEGCLDLRILKCRGGRSGVSVRIGRSGWQLAPRDSDSVTAGHSKQTGTDETHAGNITVCGYPLTSDSEGIPQAWAQRG